MDQRCKLYMLIGVPASGKSTWIKSQAWSDKTVVVSTDRFVEEYAEKQGKTYSEVFDEYMPIAVRLMANQVLVAKANKCDIPRGSNPWHPHDFVECQHSCKPVWKCNQRGCLSLDF